MSSTVKNIIIGIVVVAVLVFVYLFFIKKGSDGTALLSSSGLPVVTDTGTTGGTTSTSEISKDFITVLLSVKSIKLDDAILNDKAFLSLKDSSIVLVQVGDEGRPNPFAPIGSEITSSATPPASSVSDQGAEQSSSVGNTGGSTSSKPGVN